MTSFERFALENLRQGSRARAPLFTPTLARVSARGRKAGKAGQKRIFSCPHRDLLHKFNGLEVLVSCPGLARFPIPCRRGKRPVLLNTGLLPGGMGCVVLFISAAGPA